MGEIDPEKPLRVAFYIRGTTALPKTISSDPSNIQIFGEGSTNAWPQPRRLASFHPPSSRLSDIEDGEYVDHPPSGLEQQTALRRC